MSTNGRTFKSINMRKLKRNIDKSIRGILSFLENNNIDFINSSVAQMKTQNLKVGNQHNDTIDE
jgi:hypothetical protein